MLLVVRVLYNCTESFVNVQVQLHYDHTRISSDMILPPHIRSYSLIKLRSEVGLILQRDFVKSIAHVRM